MLSRRFVARSWRRQLLLGATALALPFLPGCLDLGVQSAGDTLSPTFAGIDSVTVISPTAVTVKWTPRSNYVSYNVFISTQDSPVGQSVFSNYTVTGLNPGTNYSFSVSGVKSNGSQDGIAQQVTVTTWNQFPGAATAVATGPNSVSLTWNYQPGPTYQVYYAVGAPPTSSQLLSGLPNMITQSTTGASVTGLAPLTNYYFSVVAAYQDGTTSLPTQSQLSAQTLPAQVTTSQLVTMPTITAPLQTLSTTNAKFTVTGSLPTYVTQVYFGILDPPSPGGSCLGGAGLPSNLIGSITGNGTIAAAATWAIGTYNVSVVVTDLPSCQTMHAVVSGMTVTGVFSSTVPSVSATTTTALTSLPTVTGPTKSLTPFPTFTVANSSPSYRVDLYNGANLLGTLNANGHGIYNGTIQIGPTTPLPRGLDAITPKVTDTATGLYANLPNLNILVRWIDGPSPPNGVTGPVPYSGPTSINGVTNGAGFGSAMAIGDFNCDGYPDLAVGGPFSSFGPAAQIQSISFQQAGGVAVYYGAASGMDFSHPQLIYPPPHYSDGGSLQYFGASLASGNINGDTSGGHSCDDLAVGAPLDDPGNQNWYRGALYIYYGNPTKGLQAGTPSTNATTCQIGTSNCSAAVYYDSTFYTVLGNSVAVGDFNGDGYDDVAIGGEEWADSQNSNAIDGGVRLYFGSAYGLTPLPQPILMPAHTTSAGYNMRFGRALAMGYVSDNKNAPYTGGTAHRKKDLLIVAYNPTLDAQGVTRAGAAWIQGTANIGNVVDINGRLKVTSAGPPADLTTAVAGWSYIAPLDLAAWAGSGMSNVTVGDFNGDGWDDVVLSSPRSSSSYPWGGSAFIYYGAPGGPHQAGGPAVTNTATTCSANVPDGNGANAHPCVPQIIDSLGLIGNTYFNGWGSQVANLGDTNGDGYPELGVDNECASGSTTCIGNVQMFYGGPNGVAISPTSTFSANSVHYSLFGISMGGANLHSNVCSCHDVGCVNPATALAETCNDLAIAAPGEGITAPNGAYMQMQGVTHLFYNGGSGFGAGAAADSARTDPTLTPSKVSYKFTGFEEAKIAGDFNGDGYADVIGRAFFNGKPCPFTSAGSCSTNYGTPGNTSTSATPAFVIFYGSPTGLITSPSPSYMPLNPTDPQAIDGWVTGINDGGYPDNTTYGDGWIYSEVWEGLDMNGDGFTDFAVGGTYYAYFFYGSALGLITTPNPLTQPLSRLDPKILSEGNLYQFDTGYYSQTHEATYTTAGDFNGDGYQDWATAAHGTHSIIVIYGGPNGPIDGGVLYNPTQGATYTSAPPEEQLNWAPNCVAGAPPTCYPELICLGNGVGSYYPAMLCGGATPWATDGVNPAIGAASDYRAWSIINVGDTDGDGTDDLLVSAGQDSVGASTQAGVIDIFYGSKTLGLSPTNYVRLLIDPSDVTKINRYLGQPVQSFSGPDQWSELARGYDINGDGLADIVAGGPGETPLPPQNWASNGAAYVVYGINGGWLSLSDGVNVTCAPGPAYPCTANIHNTGVADFSPKHVVENTASCDGAGNCNVLRFTQTGAASGGYFGYGVLGLSDITGDAFGDVAVSSYGYGGGSNGSIYIFSGSATGLNVGIAPTTTPVCNAGVCPPILINPPQAQAYNSNYGTGSGMYWHVAGFSGVGDVDGDGQKDFLILSTFVDDPAGNGYGIGGFFLYH